MTDKPPSPPRPRPKASTSTSTTRRTFIKGIGAAAAALTAPWIWVPNKAYAQSVGRDSAKHLIYIRLRSGFRFTTAFNGDVADQFNPYGAAETRAAGAEWGASSLLDRAPWLDGDAGAALRARGMLSVSELANRIAVIPCVDHEPLSGSADGNHGSGLERYWTGFANGGTSFFTMINHGLRDRISTGVGDGGEVVLPAFCLGDSGMARGAGAYAAHRPPVVQSGGFDGFALAGSDRVPEWSRSLSHGNDARYRGRFVDAARSKVDAYLETRRATQRFTEIFESETLRISGGDTPIDGITNDDLRTLLGDDTSARNIRLALRLFHFGCPAVYLDQGGYDMHSGEESQLPGRMDSLNRLVSGLMVALDQMQHPSGGTYWDHTVVVLGSEFGRTARGNRFNSARGSDHGGDFATRWMSMPFFGGPIARAGAQLGGTRASDLRASGKVYSYRSVLKTLMDALGADHSEFFPADAPFDDLFV